MPNLDSKKHHTHQHSQITLNGSKSSRNSPINALELRHIAASSPQLATLERQIILSPSQVGSNVASDARLQGKSLKKPIHTLEEEMLQEQRVIEGMFGESIKRFDPVEKIKDAISINLSQNPHTSKASKKNPFDLQTRRKFEDFCGSDVSEKRFETDSTILLPGISTKARHSPNMRFSQQLSREANHILQKKTFTDRCVQN